MFEAAESGKGKNPEMGQRDKPSLLLMQCFNYKKFCLLMRRCGKNARDFTSRKCWISRRGLLNTPSPRSRNASAPANPDAARADPVAIPAASP